MDPDRPTEATLTAVAFIRAYRLGDDEGMRVLTTDPARRELLESVAAQCSEVIDLVAKREGVDPDELLEDWQRKAIARVTR